MSQKIKFLVFFLVVSLVVMTCKQKAKEGDCVHEKAHIYVSVVDNKNLKIENAIINVFDSYENFEKAKADRNNAAYATGSYISLLTDEVEIPVDPYVEHWVLVTKYDSIQLKYLSSELDLSKIEPLQSCSDYHVTVNLDPVGAVVAFWTASNLNLNIKIKLNGVLDSLTSVSATEPIDGATPGPPSQVNFPVQAGTYQYQASSAGNCSWQGEVTIANGDFRAIKLEPCERAVVAFYIETLDANKFPITLYIDNTATPVGTINAPHTGTVANACPGAPVAANVLYVYMEPGVAHTYKAVSAAGSTIPCTWTGSTGVLSPDCSLDPAIKLGAGCN